MPIDAEVQEQLDQIRDELYSKEELDAKFDAIQSSIQSQSYSKKDLDSKFEGIKSSIETMDVLLTQQEGSFDDLKSEIAEIKSLLKKGSNFESTKIDPNVSSTGTRQREFQNMSNIQKHGNLEKLPLRV